ncbi:MAG: hypothetical protein SFW08_08935 [Gemmatimonadaceae bacterium]|nr:hypothetical protein [Gemmatimonadaceae bacterium]
MPLHRWGRLAHRGFAALLLGAPLAARAQTAPVVSVVELASSAIAPSRAQTIAGLAAALRASQDRRDWQWSSHLGVGAGGGRGAATAAGASLTLSPMRWPSLALALDGEGAAFANVVETAGSTARVGARGFWRLGAVTIVPSVSAATTRRSEISPRSARVADVAVQWQTGDWRLTGFAARHATTDWPLIEASGFLLTRSASAYALRDHGAGIEWGTSSRRVGLTWSRRTGLNATSGRDASWLLSAEWPLTRRVSAVVVAGDVLADPLRSTVAGQLVSLGLRAVVGGGVPRPRRGAIATMRLVERGGVVTAELLSDGPLDEPAEWTSSHVDWVPQPFQWERGRWVARVPLPSGRHRLAVRRPGGPWESPAGAPAASDDFGGSAALIVVP